RRSRPCSGRQRLLLLQDQGRTWRGCCGTALVGISGTAGTVGQGGLPERTPSGVCREYAGEPGYAGTRRVPSGDALLQAAQGGRASRGKIYGTLRRAACLDRGSERGGWTWKRLTRTCH